MNPSIPIPARAYARAFSAQPHLLDPSGSLAVWFTNPDGVVLQFVQEAQATAETVAWLRGAPLAELKRRFGDQPLVVVIDLTRMQGRDKAARSGFLELSKGFAGRIRSSVVVPPMRASPMYLVTLKTTLSIVRVFGLHFEFAESASDAIHALGLHAAP